jgi:hypothetical protein
METLQVRIEQKRVWTCPGTVDVPSLSKSIGDELCQELASRKRSGSDVLLREIVLTGQRESFYVAKRRGYGVTSWKICHRKGGDVLSSRA